MSLPTEESPPPLSMPRSWGGKQISGADAEAFRRNCQELGFLPKFILPHDSFLINLGSPDNAKLKMSQEAFLDEMKRCEQLGLTMLNFHPGSHLSEVPSRNVWAVSRTR